MEVSENTINMNVRLETLLFSLSSSLLFTWGEESDQLFCPPIGKFLFRIVRDIFFVRTKQWKTSVSRLTVVQWTSLSFVSFEPHFLNAPQLKIAFRLTEVSLLDHFITHAHVSHTFVNTCTEMVFQYLRCTFDAVAVPEDEPAARRKYFASGLALSVGTASSLTLPASRFIFGNSQMQYAVVRFLHPSRPDVSVMIAQDLFSIVSDKIGTAAVAHTLVAVLGKETVGVTYFHSLQAGLV